MKYKIEKTSIDEKETFIHIDNKEKSVELATNDAKVYNRLVNESNRVAKLQSKIQRFYLDTFCD